MYKKDMKKLWFVTEIFYPENEGAAYYLTEVACEIAKSIETNVLCSQPKFFEDRPDRPIYEKYCNVNIYRCKSLHLNRHNVIFRLISSLTFCLVVFFKLIFNVKKNDIILCGCYPPPLVFFTAIASAIKRSKHVLWVMDIHPDIAQAVGLLEKKGFFFHLVKLMKKKVYDSSSKVIVIGRDMKEYLIEIYKVKKEKVEVIPLFIDVESVFPEEFGDNCIVKKHGLLDHFVIGIAGNLGAVHDIDLLISASKRLIKYTKIKFLVIGSGKKKDYLVESLKTNGINNFIFENWMPRSKEKEIGNACDVAVSALYIPGLFGLACASRSTSITAAGKPMIAVIEKNTELALLIEEFEIGWRVEPGNIDEFVKTIESIYNNKQELKKYGSRARNVAESYFNSKINIPRYAESIISA
jgi:glycosyltransferase involved in cell wall biosynthesis